MKNLEVSDIPNILELSLYLKVPELAEKYDVSHSKLQLFLTSHGIILSTYKNEVRKNQCLAILNAGGTVHDASAKIGLDIGRVYGLVKGHKIPDRSKNDFKTMKHGQNYAVKRNNKRCTNKTVGVKNSFVSASQAQKVCDALNKQLIKNQRTSAS